MDQPETPAENINNTEATVAPEPVAEGQITKPGLKRHLNKRNAWIAAGLLVVMVLGGLLFWRSRRMGYAKQFTIEGWHAVASQSDDIAGITKGEPSLDKASNLSSSLRKLNGTMKDQKISLSLIPLLLNDRRALTSYKSFVDKMGSYTAQVASMSDDITAITDNDVTTAQSLSNSAQEQTATTKNDLKYLTENVNTELFKVNEYLESLKKVSDEAKAKLAAEAKTKKQQAEQDALDKQLVELSLTGFMDGYVAGDATKMKRYMTAAFAAEYNFSQLSADNRKYNYPSSYRLVSNTKNDATTYTAQLNVLYKYKSSESDATNQYTSGYSYAVTYVTASGRWLVNTEKTN